MLQVNKRPIKVGTSQELFSGRAAASKVHSLITSQHLFAISYQTTRRRPVGLSARGHLPLGPHRVTRSSCPPTPTPTLFLLLTSDFSPDNITYSTPISPNSKPHRSLRTIAKM